MFENIKKLFGKFLCKIGKHDRVIWSIEKCLKERVFGGAFAPYKCRRCGYESQRFPIPCL